MNVKAIKPIIFIIMLAAFVNLPVSSVNAEENKTGGGYAASRQIEGVGYTSEIYDATNGLPTSDANFILGASNGYVWIGGYSGIIRYDGSVFERLDTADGLTSGRGFMEDSYGRIWVATNDNGVVVIDNDNTVHITYKDGLTSSSIRAFAEDKEGNVYVGSTAGVCYVDADMKVHQVDDERINNEGILKLDADINGTIYGQTKGGAIFAIESGSIVEYYTSRDLGVDKITTIMADPRVSQKVYIGTEGSDIYYGNFGDDFSKLKRISVYPLENTHWINYDCDRVWISSTTVMGYLDKGDSFHVLDHTPMDSAIEMITSDYQGNLWVASSTQGVMKIVTNNFLDMVRESGIEPDVVNATCLHNGSLYVGCDGGLQIVDAGGHAVVSNDLIEYMKGSRIRCISEDSKGNLWLSTFTKDLGLVCYSSDGKITNFTVDSGLPSNEVRCALEASDGSIMVGTNGGLAVIKGGSVSKMVGADSGVKNTVFLTVAEGDKGEIYVGTDGDGIYVINGSDIKVIGRDDGLTSDVVMRIKKDEDKGLYWIITSNSIEYMKDGVIKNVESFPYNNNYDLYYDNNDNLWVLSSFGVYCVDKDDMIEDKVSDYKLYTAANGLTNIPTSNSYSALDGKGNLYISGRDGVSKVNINDFYDGTAAVQLYVSSVTFNNSPITADENGVYTIPAGLGRTQITPAVLDYTMSNPMVRVFLEGSEDEGITVERSKLSTLEYTGLDYGNYTLHIQIVDSNLGEVIQDETFGFVKEPRFTELLIVRIMAVVLIALLFGLFVWRLMTGTVIRRQYEEIRAARDEAERANSAKSRFLANMSHEIRTPINTIMGMDEMILREDSTNVPQGYFMSVVNYALDIRNASESLLGLINDLLDISKIESGKMHLVEQEYDTAELLRSIVTMIRVRSNEKELKFEVVIDEMMPSRLYGDSGKIKQILLNLLTNAVKYTDYGGFTLKVSMDGREDDSCDLRFSVKDTGIGVKPEDMDKLFTAYERLDEEKNSTIQGTGLGLDISRRFAELMGGKLWCESQYGEGSEFVLTVAQKIADVTPIGEFTERDDSDVKGPYVPQFVAPDADVLVVDDNPMNLNVIKGLLKATKVFVTTAASGEECLEKLKYGTFNIVLLDHMMPGMDGVETVGHIRETMPDLPVYALTANSAAGEEFYKSKGFNGYLAKPIDSRTLERTIMKHLPEEIMQKATEEDAVEDLAELPDTISWVNEVEDLSVEEGVKNSGGVASFINALHMFADTLEASSKVIEDAYNADDLKLFTVKVHSLKTSARIVGAQKLSKLAERLEEAGNKGENDFIRENTAVLLKQYRDFKDKLARLGQDNKTGPDNRENIPEEELNDAYEALREVIPQMDYDSVEMIIQQLEGYRLPEEDETRIKELKALLKTFDWEKMEDLISNG